MTELIDGTIPDCLFCRVIRGELPAHVVDETSETLVFLDRSPVFHGHCLVIPKRHRETLLDVPLGEVGALFEEVQRVALAVEQGLGADGSFVAMNNRVSQSVPHVHVHVVPRRKKDGLRGFFWPRHKYDGDEHAASTRDAIRNALTRAATG